MICVFDIGNTDYATMGNAVLQPTACKLHNIAGGNYDLTMEHPIDPEGKWKHLVPGAIIRCPVPREEIENAYAGYEVDVYKTTAKADLRESASEPTVISYPAWPNTTSSGAGEVGMKTTSGGRNFECTYWDPNSREALTDPQYSDWWREIARYTNGAAVLVTLQSGTELYFVEDYNTTWYKMSTYYGIVGYIKKNQVTFDRHLTPSETKPRIITEQLFRIEKPTVDTKNRSVSVTAKHVSYDLNGVLIQDVNISQASPAMALGKIVEGFMINYPGTIATNLDTDENGTYTQQIKGKNGTYALLDPDKGIVSTFRAAFKRDNWDLFVMTQENTDKGFRIRYRKNMLGVNLSKDSSNLITRVVPVAKDEKGESLYLPEKWVDSSMISNYPVVKMEQLTVQGQVGKDKGTGDGSTWTESDLLDEMRAKAGERFSVDKADQVTVTLTVDFNMLGDTDEYRDIRETESVLLYDSVTVIDEEIDLSMQLIVSEWEWDAIRQKVTAIKLVNAMNYSKGNVTGYNVQAKSIGADKLSDDVQNGIIDQVLGIIPEYSDPGSSRPTSVEDNNPSLNWSTKSKVGTVSGTDLHVTMPANPDTWRPVQDNLTSTSTTDSLSAKQGKVLKDYIDGFGRIKEFSLESGQKLLTVADNNTLVPSSSVAIIRLNSGDSSDLPNSYYLHGFAIVYKSSSHRIFVEAHSYHSQAMQTAYNRMDSNETWLGWQFYPTGADFAYFEPTNTASRSYTAGTYIYWRNSLRRVKSAISSGGTISTNNTETIETKGIINYLHDNILANNANGYIVQNGSATITIVGAFNLFAIFIGRADHSRSGLYYIDGDGGVLPVIACPDISVTFSNYVVTITNTGYTIYYRVLGANNW